MESLHRTSDFFTCKFESNVEDYNIMIHNNVLELALLNCKVVLAL